jgi:uncharacterized membrane protein SirB2
MIEYYLQIRAAHLFAVVVSGTLFAARGLGVLAGARWPMHPIVRYSSYTVDTVLLTAALMLVSALPAAAFANHWLTVKLVLVVVYVALGTFALKRARTPRGRSVCYLAALVVFALVIGIARRHSPLGWLAHSN